MERIIGRFSPIAFVLLRVVSGLMMACHGGQKVLGMFGDPAHPMHPPVGSLFWVGGIIELVGGFLIALGLFGSIAGFILSGEMAVAYFMVHAPGGPLPIINKGELAVLYCFVFLFIACHGSGILSLDSVLFRRTVSGKWTDRI